MNGAVAPTVATPVVVTGTKMANPAEFKSSDHMLGTFVGFLRTRCNLIVDADLDEAGKRSLADVRKRIDGLSTTPCGFTWDEAYAIERDLVLLQRGEPLHQQVLRLLDKADEQAIQGSSRLRTLYTASVGKLYDSAKTPPVLISSADASLRYLASVILETTHWELKKRYLAIPKRKAAMQRVILVGLASFLLFMLPYLALHIFLYAGADIHVEKWNWLLQWTVLSSGLLGAFFSRLLIIQQSGDMMNLEELENANSWRSICLRGAVGMIGALIVFYVLTSGLVEGKLVPKPIDSGLKFVDVAGGNLPGGGTLKLVVPMADLSLLAVWCFLAGFSERLVPDILTAAETQLKSGSAGKSAQSG